MFLEETTIHNKNEQTGIRAWYEKTRFFSVHGLPPGRGQKLDESTAFDMYLLAMELLKHPQYLRWSSTRWIVSVMGHSSY
ncbi:MAG: hypothetical protein CM1200mP28_18340 [Deltaproteobacteria bacterium]|nr:MAG: hypothetical protein CM1200mP28_18340 [Deltaproteobacteria bacterium]